MAQHDYRSDIQTGFRFIEDQQIRIMKQCRADRLVAGCGHAEEIKQRRRLCGEHSLIDPPEPAHELQVLAPGLKWVEIWFLGNIAEMTPEGDKVELDIHPVI